MSDITLDCLQKKCPLPVLMTKKELKKMTSGETLKVIVDDIGALKDIPALLSKTGDELVESSQDNGNITFVIKKA